MVVKKLTSVSNRLEICPVYRPGQPLGLPLPSCLFIPLHWPFPVWGTPCHLTLLTRSTRKPLLRRHRTERHRSSDDCNVLVFALSFN